MIETGSHVATAGYYVAEDDFELSWLLSPTGAGISAIASTPG